MARNGDKPECGSKRFSEKPNEYPIGANVHCAVPAWRTIGGEAVRGVCGRMSTVREEGGQRYLQPCVGSPDCAEAIGTTYQEDIATILSDANGESYL